ncbi:uncharacterized protein (DUF2252 family) [Kineococcus xinjiangensis]|uniref:Uncharacterized protein (DUF2252 family) n=1 Tax=Kineococcus xinjiangensis TaxID=512762 RepID=A0A2S6IDI1_9ACTN|nr:DUF2252 family protein [Kineococcus xinjiangensis]PPK92275.1 uncharacterized protein (DUF2252 family) [Kineococcus xinjiangensis]
MHDANTGPATSGTKPATKSGTTSGTRSRKTPGTTSRTKPGTRSGPQRPREVVSRVEAFQELARARACGEMVLIPRMLTGNDRRIHVRQTLREDHHTRITDHEEDAEAKFEKLAGSLFSFFRGTCLLFYRDMAGEDAWMPTVLAAGDIHPENFGVVPNVDNVPIFGIDDYDEAYYAPFTWDLKRGSVGFLIAAHEVAGYGRSRRRRIVEHFVRGYVAAMNRYASEGLECLRQLRQDNSPPLVADLLEGASSGGRARWLEKKYLDEHRRGFRADDRLVPVSSRRQEFQEVIDRFVESNDVAVPDRAAGMRVKDVAERKGQGTASLGLTRYYVLIEGPCADGSDDILLELKQARRSALAGLVPPSDFEHDGHGERIAHAHRVHLEHGDVFNGSVEHEGLSFLVRERSAFRDDIDLDDLSKSQWLEYAEICGRVVAHAHATSGGGGQVDHDVAPAVVAAIGLEDLFVDDIVRFAEESAQRVRRDHRDFLADHALGAYRRVDHVYR